MVAFARWDWKRQRNWFPKADCRSSTFILFFAALFHPFFVRTTRKPPALHDSSMRKQNRCIAALTAVCVLAAAVAVVIPGCVSGPWLLIVASSISARPEAVSSRGASSASVGSFQKNRPLERALLRLVLLKFNHRGRECCFSSEMN